jgi:hypothetical protein
MVSPERIWQQRSHQTWIPPTVERKDVLSWSEIPKCDRFGLAFLTIRVETDGSREGSP